MENIESSKENVRPLRTGRKIDSLINSINSTVEFDKQKDEFELQRQQLTGIDLLNAYYEYIIWIEQNYSTNETVLKHVLEECLDHFFKVPEKDIFINDKKLLSVFLKHTSMCNTPLEFFKTAYLSGFFKKLAQFYIEWSYHYEVNNDLVHAIKILQGGKNKKAQPAETLQEAIQKFTQRKDEYKNNPSTVPSGDHRKAFNQLKVKVGRSGQTMAPVDRVTNIVVQPIQNRGLSLKGQAGPSKAMSSKNKPVAEDNFIINCDNPLEEEEKIEGPVNLPFEKQAIPQSIKGNENVIKPGKWNECAMKGSSKSSKMKDGFKVLNEAEIKPKKAQKHEDYSLFSWKDVASEMFTPDDEFSFEEIRWKKYQEKKKLEGLKKTSVKNALADRKEKFVVLKEVHVIPNKVSVPKNEFPIPKAIPTSSQENDLKSSDKDLEVLDSIQSPPHLKNEFVSPTELLDMSDGKNICKTLDFTTSNFRTEDFSPFLGSTPQTKRPKLSIQAGNLSPLIEVSYKSSSSSGGFTTTTTTTNNETDKTMPNQDFNEYPFKDKSIRFMLKCLKNPVEKRSGYFHEEAFFNFKRHLFASDDQAINKENVLFSLKFAEHEFSVPGVAYCKTINFVDLLCSYKAGQNFRYLLRFLEKDCLMKWDFYIRNEICQRFTNQKNPLFGLFKQEVYFYENFSISVDHFHDYFILSEFSFHKYPFISSFIIFELIKLIEKLHSMKIVSGNINSRNILVMDKKDMNSYLNESFLEILNLSSAVDLSIIPENCLSSAWNFEKIDWLGLLETVCSMLLEWDTQSEDIEFKIKALSNLNGKGCRNEYMSMLGSVLSKMFEYIFETKTSLNLESYKQKIEEIYNLSFENLTTSEFGSIKYQALSSRKKAH